MTEHLANSLADIMLLDQDQAPVRIGDAWQDSTALVVFIRHFG